MKYYEMLELFDVRHLHSYLLFADGVVAPGEVVGRVLLARDHQVVAEQLTVRASPDFV
jgi:hypothetical protein